jgi:hypothetical protein
MAYLAHQLVYYLIIAFLIGLAWGWMSCSRADD